MGMRLRLVHGSTPSISVERPHYVTCILAEATLQATNLVLEAECNGKVHHGILVRYETLHGHHVLVRVW